MQLINSTLLNEVTKQAQESPRLRMNCNFHCIIIYRYKFA